MKHPLMVIAALSAAICSTVAATPAMADDDVAIEYRDLNLTTAEGQKKLERRIDRVAKKVCGIDQRQVGTLIRNRDAKQCYEQVKAQATRQMAAMVDEQRLGG